MKKSKIDKVYFRDMFAKIISEIIANNYLLWSDERFYCDWTSEHYCGAISACKCCFKFINIMKCKIINRRILS